MTTARDRTNYQNLVLVTAPTDDPVDVIQAKAQSRILINAEDALIEGYLYAATAHLDGRDGILARCLMTQTWDYVLPRFPCERSIALPLAPVQTIVSVTYKDLNGAPQTFAAANYQLSADLDWYPQLLLAYGASWPGTRDEPDAVTVRVRYGYLPLVPIQIRQAIVLLVAHWFMNREPVNIGNITTELPFGVRALLEPYMRTVF